MAIDKLTPMTEFVLLEKERYINDRETPANLGLHNYLKHTANYANFLRQDLDEWMFIGEEALFEGFILCADEEGSYIENEADVTLFPDEFGTATIEQLVQDDLALTQKAKQIIYGNQD